MKKAKTTWQNNEVRKLCELIELTVGRKMMTPKDFEFLSNTIMQRLHMSVSPTTLKRLWGYVRENVCTRFTTLSILSRFVGYHDWDHLCSALFASGEEPDEQLIMTRCVCSQQLRTGQMLEISWGNSCCVVRYLGDYMYEVIRSSNTILMPADTFQCSYFFSNAPVYVISFGTRKQCNSRICGRAKRRCANPYSRISGNRSLSLLYVHHSLFILPDL